MSIKAVHITRISVDTTVVCRRCGCRLNNPRLNSKTTRPRCEDCRDVEALEDVARARGVDLAELPDNQFDTLRKKSTNRARDARRARDRKALQEKHAKAA